MTTETTTQKPDFVCSPKRLPPHLWVQAATNAIKLEPRNYGRAPRLLRIAPKAPLTPEHIAAVTARKWPATGVRLTVGFMDAPEGEFVKRLNRAKTITYFEQTQGWSKAEVIQQVLTPPEDATLTETARADEYSIMCYQIPDAVTKDGQPILGGSDIDASDFAFAAQICPKHTRVHPHHGSVQTGGNDESAVIEISGGEIT